MYRSVFVGYLEIKLMIALKKLAFSAVLCRWAESKMIGFMVVSIYFVVFISHLYCNAIDLRSVKPINGGGASQLIAHALCNIGTLRMC